MALRRRVVAVTFSGALGIQDILESYPSVKPQDLEINTGHAKGGLFLHVKHRPSGKERFAHPITKDLYELTLRTLLVELLKEIAGPPAPR